MWQKAARKTARGSGTKKAPKAGSEAGGVSGRANNTMRQDHAFAPILQCPQASGTKPPLPRGIEARYGWLAQLVERLVYIEDVGGSSPSPPTSLRSASFGSASLLAGAKRAALAKAVAPKLPCSAGGLFRQTHNARQGSSCCAQIRALPSLSSHGLSGHRR